MKKVLILFGGDSFEHDVSCKSAKNILESIDRKLFDVTSVGIKKDWFIFNDDSEYLDSNWINHDVIKIDNIIEFIKNFDVVFNIIHGNTSEDGKLQGLFELFDIKYIGCDSLSSMICYDKAITKIMFDYYNIPQVNYVICNKYYKISEILNKLDFPLIIKPSKCGSSIGINKANNKQELKKYINEALKYDDILVIEEFINARELECSVLENKKLIISNIGEIKSCNEFYDYESKYDKESTLIIPAELDKNIINDIKKLAIKVFKTLRCKGLSRIDFFYSDKIYVNEINTLPGFTNISMFPKLLVNKGISYKDLITIIINNAK